MRRPNCGHDNREGHNFRGHCGGRLGRAGEYREFAVRMSPRAYWKSPIITNPAQ